MQMQVGNLTNIKWHTKKQVDTEKKKKVAITILKQITKHKVICPY